MTARELLEKLEAVVVAGHGNLEVEELETQLSEAIRERDEAMAELKTRTESLHTAVRLKLQAQSQRDALAKALLKLSSKLQGTVFWTDAEEALVATLDPTPQLQPKSGDEYWKMVEETAKKVDAWPDWKKGAPADGGK